MKRCIAAVLVGFTALVLVATPASAAGHGRVYPWSYRSQKFSCSHTATNASVKMYEHGLSGVMQFQVKFYAQVFYGGRWHYTTHRRFASRVFSNSYANHYYGYITQGFTWNTNRYHREVAKMIWWHRYPTYKVATHSLVTRSCR